MSAEKNLHVTALRCRRQQQWLFAPLSFQLGAHELLLIEGANGSGKSSLLRLLAGLATPAQGEIFWQGTSIQTERNNYQEALHYIGHTHGIKLGLTVMENIRLAHHLALSPIDNEKIVTVLTTLALHTQRDTLAHYLSAGQKRRLALAKLCLLPKILWLLDEPLTALDAATQKFFLTHLENHLAQGGMVVMSSHQPLSMNAPRRQTLRLSTC